MLVLIVLCALVASLMISRFLRSEAFRKLMGVKTGEALYSEASYSPLNWSGPSMFVDSLQATGRKTPSWKACVPIRCGRRAIFQGAWR